MFFKQRKSDNQFPAPIFPGNIPNGNIYFFLNFFISDKDFFKKTIFV